MTTVIAEKTDAQLGQLLEWIQTEGDSPILVNIPRQSALAVVGLVQLATRHPGISETMEAIAREFVDAVIRQVPPGIGDLMDRGWDAQEDVVL